ncbi:hypothetical protein ODS41_01165 [Pyrobaculum sp. 3827-6]|uniref:hypothetical protein n=1 Tax=Pyrobaculum sp. 3827-6 TaxID=2983604 RepID=UPI0021D96158|nr:hypothetical protein [Pyrobaculum sp. 3827-6]MCU7786540.1 hypothetical protein [Pyrobaculum sp. 3827-6]
MPLALCRVGELAEVEKIFSALSEALYRAMTKAMPRTAEAIGMGDRTAPSTCSQATTPKVPTPVSASS